MTVQTGLLRQKLQSATARLPYLIKALGLVWASARGWAIVWLVLLVMQGLLPVATVYLTRALVDSLVMAVEVSANGSGTWADLRPALLAVVGMALVLLLTELFRGATNYVRTVQSELVHDHIADLVQRQSLRLDLVFFDSSAYYDQLYRARYLAIHQPTALLENLGNLLQNGLTLAAMVVVLIPYGIWLPVALVAGSLPAFYVVLQHRLTLHRWRMQTTHRERRASYYFWLLTGRESASELRLFDLGEHYRRLYRSLRDELRDERVQLARGQSLAELGAGIASLGVTALVLVWMLGQALRGLVTLGDLALFYQAFSQGQRLTRSLLQNVGEIYNNSLFLEDLFAFLDLGPTVVSPPDSAPAPVPLRDGICFDNVTFQYPGSTRTTLDAFNLSIAARRVTAIVGANGAGKSTLIKLLARLYAPTSGTITFDGVDAARMDLVALRSQVTMLFQQPVQFSATAAENIALGDLCRAGDRPAIERAAHAAGADAPIADLPHGYDTLLGKWFADGSDLSVGEWQRLALARAYLRQAPIIVLDEPTSAMDPWAETDWLDRFRRPAEGRTTLIITHRFTTARYADVIHVMDEGRIVESGNHEELLAMNGRYAKSWQMQVRQRSQPVSDVVSQSHSTLKT